MVGKPGIQKSHFRKSLTMFLMGFCFLSAQAQKSIQYGNQQWIQYYTRILLNDRLYIPADAGLRWRKGFEQISQHIIRAGIGYWFNPNISMAAGIAQSGLYTDGNLKSSEIRPYQELALITPLKKLTILNRFRVEERFFSYKDGSPSDFNFRFRYRVMLNVPFYRIKSSGHSLAFLLGDEIFLNAGKKIVYNTFDQNRFLTGIQYSTENLELGLNYNQQFVVRNEPGKYVQEYIIWLTCTHTIHLNKKKGTNKG